MTDAPSSPLVLVTGATGFIGSHVVRAARDRGWRVAALVRAATDRKGRAPFDGDVRPGDLGDEASLVDALRGVDAVVHLAGLTRARNEAAFLGANGAGTARLVRAARAAAPRLRRFVYVSSLAAGGPSNDGRPVREDDAPRPVSAYGRSKLAGETALRSEAGAMPWTIIRPPIVYGPEERDVLELFRLARGRFVPVVGGGAARYSIVHGEDLARGIVDALLAERAAGGTYYVAEATTYSHREILGHLADAVSGKPRLVSLPPICARVFAACGSGLKPFLKRPPLLTLDKLPEVLAAGWTCDVAAARRDFGFETRIALQDGARATAAWYREKGWL